MEKHLVTERWLFQGYLCVKSAGKDTESLEPISCPICIGLPVGLALQNLGVFLFWKHLECRTPAQGVRLHTARLHQLIPLLPVAAPLGSTPMLSWVAGAGSQRQHRSCWCSRARRVLRGCGGWGLTNTQLHCSFQSAGEASSLSFTEQGDSLLEKQDLDAEVELLLFWPHLELRDSNQILSVPQEQRSAWSGGVKHLSDPL